MNGMKNNMTQVQNVPERGDILAALERAKKYTMTTEALVARISTKETVKATTARVAAMLRDGQIKKKNNTLAANTKDQRVGKVIRHPKGFGFLDLDGEEPDWFIPYAEMERCFPGEQVIAYPKKDDGRGTTAKIVGRASMLTSVTGKMVMSDDGSTMQFSLNDSHTLPVIVDDSLLDTAVSDGSWVFGDFTAAPSGNRPHVFQVKQVLDAPHPVSQIRYRAVQSHGFPLQHSAEAIRETKQAADMAAGIQNDTQVTDLTHLPFVSIDGESSRDLDDLVYSEQRPDGKWDLWVAIADVTRFVSPDTQMNADAYDRAVSVYTPGESFPMLPEQISHDLCSMLPDVLRYALAVHIELSAKGEMESYRFMSAKVRSAQRFTYTRVAALLDSPSAASEEEKTHLSNLTALAALDKVSRERGDERGAMEIDRDEPILLFNQDGDIDGFTSTRTNAAHKLIESAMVYANVAAANFLEGHFDTALYRHHPGLQEDGLVALNAFLEEVGLDPLTPSCSGLDCNARRMGLTSESQIETFERLLRGAMTFARYTTNETSHFGMSLEKYTHFTSPIRRYGDIIVHRMIKFVLGEHERVEFTHAQAEHISHRAYEASMAERDCQDMLCARWWDKQPEAAKQNISVTLRGRSEKMLFLSLGDTPIEGAMTLEHFLSRCSDERVLMPGATFYGTITEIDTLTGRIRLELA